MRSAGGNFADSIYGKKVSFVTCFSPATIHALTARIISSCQPYPIASIAVIF